MQEAIVSVLISAPTDGNDALARIVAVLLGSKITYCSARAHMFVYDRGRNFWSESVMERESVEDAVRKIAGYIDSGEFERQLAIFPTSKRATLATRAKWLRESMLTSDTPTIRNRIRELVSH